VLAGAAIVLLVLGFNFPGDDGLRDAIDPKRLGVAVRA
jgi:ABC-type dipeptide/oligopeptide/nickel transport system permease subunit